MATLLERIRAARDFESGRFLSLEADRRIGWIRRDLVVRLRRWPEVFAIDESIVGLRPQGEADRTAALAVVTHALAEDGTIPGWRDETYAIPHDVPFFHIERAAVDFFGLTSAASHLNGYVQSANGLRVWIARRSATKSVDPGFLDTLVGGGIRSGQDASQTLLRECHEEAGIERELAMRANTATTLEVHHEVARGLHSEILYAHDLELPADFRPRNVDGEVGEFMLLGAAETADRIASGEFTVEAGLVTLDFLVRKGAIGPDASLLAAIDRCRVRP